MIINKPWSRRIQRCKKKKETVDCASEDRRDKYLHHNEQIVVGLNGVRSFKSRSFSTSIGFVKVRQTVLDSFASIVAALV
jgi:hypothetical protein